MIIKPFKISYISDIDDLNSLLNSNLPFKLYSTQLKLLTQLGYKQYPVDGSFLFIKEESTHYIAIRFSQNNGSASFSDVHYLISKYFLKKSFNFDFDKISYFLVPSIDFNKPNLIIYNNVNMLVHTSNANISISEQSFIYRKISTKDFFLSDFRYAFNENKSNQIDSATFIFKGSVIDLAFLKENLPELSIKITLDNFDNFEATLTENEYTLLEAFLFN